jgi:hypothetical protein
LRGVIARTPGDRKGVSSALLLALLFAAPGFAAAQTLPIPRPQPRPEGETAGEAAEPTLETAARAWDYSAGLGVGYAGNVNLSAGDGPGDFAGVLEASASRTLRSPKGQLRLSARGFGYRYAEQTADSAMNGSISIDGSQRLSQRATASATLNASLDQTQNTSILIDQGVLLAPQRTFFLTGDASATFRSSPANSWRAAVQGNRVDFPDSATLGASGSVRVTGGLDRTLGARDTLSLDLSGGRSSQPVTQGGPLAGVYWTEYGSVRWARRQSPWTTFYVEGGASFASEGVEAGLQSRWNFFGGVSVSRQVKRSSLSAFYRREVVPFFGVGGLRLTDRVALNARVPIGERWAIDLGGVYVRAAPPDEAGDRQSAADANATVSRRLAGRLWLSATGRYLHRSAIGTISALDDVRGALSLVLVPPGSTPPGLQWR